MTRSAEQPGQALNIDLCFVPEQHEAKKKLPAVSGSSGHLVIEHIAEAAERPSWPGQVFGEADLSYEAAMRQYVQATRDRQTRVRTPKTATVEAPTRWRQEWEGRAERHGVLQQRRQEDTVWQAVRQQHRQARLAHQQLSRPERKQEKERWQVQQTAWRQDRQRRREQLAQRVRENQDWHERNRKRKTGGLGQTQDRTWIAILVVTDNCTRQCLELPLFRSGSRVTSQDVIDALRQLLPAKLQFLITDQGAHFRTQWMAQFAKQHDFLHVLIYRHRPQTNGIAERFVLTLKQWLRNHSWLTADELNCLLKRFQPEYNDRPHQGLGIPGLSPNEFANRIWLM